MVLPCGHSTTVPCHNVETARSRRELCRQVVEVEMPWCGHTIKVGGCMEGKKERDTRWGVEWEALPEAQGVGLHGGWCLDQCRVGGGGVSSQSNKGC